MYILYHQLNLFYGNRCAKMGSLRITSLCESTHKVTNTSNFLLDKGIIVCTLNIYSWKN